MAKVARAPSCRICAWSIAVNAGVLADGVDCAVDCARPGPDAITTTARHRAPAAVTARAVPPTTLRLRLLSNPATRTPRFYRVVAGGAVGTFDGISTRDLNRHPWDVLTYTSS